MPRKNKTRPSPSDAVRQAKHARHAESDLLFNDDYSKITDNWDSLFLCMPQEIMAYLMTFLPGKHGLPLTQTCQLFRYKFTCVLDKLMFNSCYIDKNIRESLTPALKIPRFPKLKVAWRDWRSCCSSKVIPNGIRYAKLSLDRLVTSDVFCCLEDSLEELYIVLRYKLCKQKIMTTTLSMLPDALKYLTLAFDNSESGEPPMADFSRFQQLQYLEIASGGHATITKLPSSVRTLVAPNCHLADDLNLSNVAHLETNDAIPKNNVFVKHLSTGSLYPGDLEHVQASLESLQFSISRPSLYKPDIRACQQVRRVRIYIPAYINTNDITISMSVNITYLVIVSPHSVRINNSEDVKFPCLRYLRSSCWFTKQIVSAPNLEIFKSASESMCPDFARFPKLRCLHGNGFTKEIDFSSYKALETLTGYLFADTVSVWPPNLRRLGLTNQVPDVGGQPSLPVTLEILEAANGNTTWTNLPANLKRFNSGWRCAQVHGALPEGLQRVALPKKTAANVALHATFAASGAEISSGYVGGLLWIHIEK